MTQFVNPYTFIPLRRRTRVATIASSDKAEYYSGVITCKLTVKTPLIIPANKIKTDDLANPAHPITPFFRVDGQPLIPASSLRGPIRSMYEALTDSCLRTNDTRLQSAGGRKTPGIVEWDEEANGFVLHEANRYRIKDITLCETLSTGDEVFIRYTPEEGNNIIETAGIVDDISLNHEPGTIPGVFLQVNTFINDKGTPNRPSVFVKTGDVPTPLDDDCIRCLEKNVSDYQANNENGEQPEFSQQYKSCLDRLKRHEGLLPVWQGYERKADRTWAIELAHAQLSRSVFPQSPVTFAKALELGECGKHGETPCPACALFGFVGGKTTKSQAGHVRFTDATPVGEIGFEQVALPALLGPRPSAFEFYLRNDNAKSRRSYTPETPGTQLSGRKVYWHSPSGISRVDMEHLTGFESRAEAASVGSSFRFDVYFDRIDKTQLNQLVYTLSLGGVWDEATGKHYHKMGHGKPVGAGSVHVKVENVLVRSALGSHYAVDEWETLGLKFETLASVELTLRNISEIKWVTDFNALPANVTIDYPRTDSSSNIFDWFGDNRKRTYNDDSPTLPIYKQILPRIDDRRQTLDA